MKDASSIKNITSHLAKGEWDRVIDICQQAIAQDPQELNFYPYLAKAYAQQGKLSQAISFYQKVIGTSVNQSEVYAELGLLHSKQKKLEQAAWHYEQALNFRPDWAELQYNLAVVWHQLGKWQRAIAAYNKAIEIKPDYGAAYFNLGVLYDRIGQLEAAIATYQRAIAVEPKLVRAYSNLGSTFARKQEYEQAIAIFKQGLALDPTWATLHNNLGQVYWFNGQPGLALSSFETAIVLEPKMALAHHNLGKLWQHQGDYPQAIGFFRNVVELEPKNVLAHSNYADALQKIGDLDSALDCWRTIIELEPEFINAYCQRLAAEPEDLLETAKLACARFLQALKQGQRAETYSHLWQTYSYMGDVLLEFGGVNQAEAYYQRALQIKPDAELYLKLGNCLTQQKRIDAAIAVYRLGLQAEANHPQICFQLGKVLEHIHEPEQAVDYYETVLDRQLENLPRWQNLPDPFIGKDKLSSLPSSIYHHTQDWVRDCQLSDFNYVQLLWSDQQAALDNNRTRQPKNIKLPLPGQTLYPNCGGVNCRKCMTKLIESFQPLQIGQNAYKCSLEQAPTMPAGLPFVVTIPHGRIWVAPQKNSWVICDAVAVITPDDYLLGDLSRDYPWFLPNCPYQERIEHSIFQQEIPPVEKIKGKVALLSGLAGHVYYHWMFDILPRLELLRRSQIDLQKIDWFVVNSLSKSYQTETLSLLDIPQEKIIESDRLSHIQAEELIVPSFPGYLDWVESGTVEFLRQAFLPLVSTDKSDTKKIYVSRARAKNRHLVNESQVAELLNSQEFKTVFLEEMSVLEQVATFANAETIVAPHGSGLTNLVFCSPHTKVIELFSPNYVRTDYWMISQYLQLQHYYVVGQNFNCLSLRNLMYQNALTEDILIDLDSLKVTLQHMG